MTTRLPLFFIPVFLILITSCRSQTTEKTSVLTTEEKKICDSIQFDSTIIKEIRAYNGNKIEPFHYSLSKLIAKDSEEEVDPIFLKGIVFPEDDGKAYDLVFSLKDEFSRKGYTIFLLEDNYNKPDNIAVLKTTDKYTVLRQIKTDGINWDITNDSLISIIKTFDKKYDLELIGASGDWCEFIIGKEPQSWIQLASEVYKVCPDVVDQGAGSLDKLANEMKKTKRLYFWWD